MVLVVVAHDREALFEYMRWGFAKTWDVQVIRDRRLGQRRERVPAEPPGLERRGAERRRQPALRAELMARGFAITIK